MIRFWALLTLGLLVNACHLGAVGTIDVGVSDDVEQACGNAIVGAGEMCDGNCPSDCDDGNACTDDLLSGSSSTCDAVCDYVAVSTCGLDDGCCASACSAANDPDCSTSCGDGIIDSDESCDGNCPGSCDDGDACTADALIGSATNCSAECVAPVIAACIDADGCCPAGCTLAADSDCSGCGDGVIDPGESCDGDCPINCDDGDPCTTDTLLGSAAHCSVTCSNVPNCPGQGVMVSSISQYGITWTFDQPYEAGQYATGDWWVVGDPLTVVDIDPKKVPSINATFTVVPTDVAAQFAVVATNITGDYTISAPDTIEIDSSATADFDDHGLQPGDVIEFGSGFASNTGRRTITQIIDDQTLVVSAADLVDESVTGVVSYANTLEISGDSYSNHGLRSGDTIELVSGFAQNGGHYTIASVSGSSLTVQRADLVPEGPAAAVVRYVNTIDMSGSDFHAVGWYAGLALRFGNGFQQNGGRHIIRSITANTIVVDVATLTPEGSLSGTLIPRVLNGSMISPPAGNSTGGPWQGFDDAIVYPSGNPTYTGALNVAFDVGPSDPVVVAAGNALVSSISHPTEPNRTQISDMAVLTVVSSVPALGDLRPPYVAGGHSLAYNVAQIDDSFLKSYAPPSSAPEMSTVEDYFERPWITYYGGWSTLR